MKKLFIPFILLILACTDEEGNPCVYDPTLTTQEVTDITQLTATFNGVINNTSENCETPNNIEQGFVYSTEIQPTLNDNQVNVNGTPLSTTIENLIPNTTYYVRTFLTNTFGEFYGNELSFTTVGGAGVTFDGYTYESIVLGNGQEWMAENLRTTIYANGDPIPNVTDNTQWFTLTTGAWSHYNNDSQYENPYGKLYNWYAVNDSRNICPTGWHVPTDAEYTLLSDYFGGRQVAGSKLKSTDSQYWTNPNTNTDATNESGFSGLPGGKRYDIQQTFYLAGIYGYWWSSSEESTQPDNRAWFRKLDHAEIYVYRSWTVKTSGFSCRCVRD